MKRLSRIMLAVSICLLAVAVAYVFTIWPPERDYCLDRGGSWIDETSSCDFG